MSTWRIKIETLSSEYCPYTNDGFYCSVLSTRYKEIKPCSEKDCPIKIEQQ